MVEKFLEILAQSGITLDHILLILLAGLTLFLAISAIVSYSSAELFEMGFAQAFFKRAVAHETIGVLWTVAVTTKMVLIEIKLQKWLSGWSFKKLLKIPWLKPDSDKGLKRKRKPKL